MSAPEDTAPDDTAELQRAILRDKIRRAREMTPGERMAAGPRLFDQAVMLMRAGIRAQKPECTDEEVDREVDRRLALARRLENRGRAVL